MAALHSSVDAFEKAVKAKDLRQMVSTADAFYAVFFKIAARPIISDMLQSLKDRISTLRATSMASPSRGPYSAREMRDIARAVEKGDGEAAAEACVRHVREAANSAQVNLAKLGGMKEDDELPARARHKARQKKASAAG